MAPVIISGAAFRPILRHVLLTATILILSASLPAVAQEAEAWARCNDSNQERAIEGCTALIDLGGSVAVERRAQAYARRGIVRADSAPRLMPEVRKRMLAEAMADLDTALRLDSKISAAYRIRAVILEENGDFNRALADYSEAIRVEPNNFTPYLARGIFYEKRNDLDRALADYSRAIDLKPMNNGRPAAYPYAIRSELYSKRREFRLALADIETAIAAETSKAYLQDLNEKRDRLQRTVAPSYVASGQSAAAAGDTKRAIADFSEAIRLDANSFQAYFGRALAYDKSGDATRALEDVSTAIKRNDKSIEARALRAELNTRRSNFKDALDDLETAFKLGLKFEWSPTLEQQSAAIGRNPQSASAYTDRGWTYLMQGDIDRALSDLTTAITSDSKFANAYQLRALAYERKAQYTLALADYDAVVAILPADNPRTKPLTLEAGYLRVRGLNFLVRRGSAAREKNDLDRAMADFTQAIELSRKASRQNSGDEIAKAFYGRAQILAAQNSPAPAIADLTKAIEFDFRLREAYVLRAEMREKQGDLQPALADYDTVLSFGPRLPNAEELRARAERLRAQLKPRP